MSENQSVLQLRGGTLVWRQSGANDAIALEQPEHWDELALQLQRPDHRVVFAAPGGDIRLLELEVAPDERRHLDASLPFMLEEQISTDIDELHFARQTLDDEHVGVAVVSRELMDAWEEALGEHAESVPWIPEPLALPRRAGEWVCVVEAQSVLLRYGECLGARLEKALLEPMLGALQEEHPPERVLVYGNDEDADRALLSPLGDVAIEWRRGDLATASLLSDGDNQQIDLRQGDYAPRLPYTRWWDLWRATAAVLMVAVVVHLLSGWLDYRRLERENVALRSEIQNVYRQVNPRGAIADAERMLRRQLGDLRGDSGGQTFTSLVEPLGKVIASRDEALLANLNYSRRSDELRVNLLATSFAEVESLREDLAELGFEAELENSTRTDDRVRARLRIAARGGS